MSLSAQAKSITCLQESMISRVGAEDIKVDVRVIAATNLKIEIAEGRFVRIYIIDWL
jgi:transcriptional regulator with GAF, ATPase, and Fis domain